MTSVLYGGSPRCGRVKSWVLEGYEEERCNSLWHAGPVNICAPMDLKLSSAAVAFSIGIPSVRLQQNVEVTDLKGTSCLCMVTLIPWWREQRRCVPYATSLNWHWMGWDASQLVRTKRVSKCHVGLFIPRCPGHGQLCKFCSPISLSFSQWGQMCLASQVLPSIRERGLPYITKTFSFSFFLSFCRSWMCTNRNEFRLRCSL